MRDYLRDYLTGLGMASQERAYLEPPCPPPDLVQCEVCEYWVRESEVWEEHDGYYFCSWECSDKWWDAREEEDE